MCVATSPDLGQTPADSIEFHEIAAGLALLRRQADLSQRAVANEVDLSPSSLSRIERGLQEAPLSTLRRVAGTVGMRIEVILRPKE